MAKLTGIKALFGKKKIEQLLDEQIKKFNDQTLKTLQYVGEEFINKARTSGNYTDRTGNLRSSIGYMVFLNGVVQSQNFTAAASGKKTNSAEGRGKGRLFAQEVSQEYPQGFVLIGVAGMSYAAAVEANNFDVITGSAPEADIFKQIFDEINI
tara:strand:+ start:8978 stop:9436 length:459 start_codon:yes stop_codon:yes gene_type:complete